MTNDLSFALPDGRFNYRVGAIIIHDGKLLMVKGSAPYFYTVGGRVALHESTEQSLVREIFEETGIKCEVEQLAFVNEVFFTLASSGEQFHELAFFFVIKPNDAFGAIANGQTLGDDAETHFAWLPLDRLREHDLYPLFFKEKLQNLGDGILHIVERD